MSFKVQAFRLFALSVLVFAFLGSKAYFVAEGWSQITSPAILIVVEGRLFSYIEEKLSVFESDLEKEGYEVWHTLVTNETTPPEIRELLKSYYSQHNLVGAILIGNIKAAYIETKTLKTSFSSEMRVHIGLDPCDTYYMDLDGQWEHVENPDTKPDEDKPQFVDVIIKPSFTRFQDEYIVYLDSEDKEWNFTEIENKNQFQIEIWVSRIMAHNLEIPGIKETQIINKFFESDHTFRSGKRLVSDKAYLLHSMGTTSFDYQGLNVSRLFTTVVMDEVIKPSDLTVKLRDEFGSRLLYFAAHSDSSIHYLNIGNITTNDLIDRNKNVVFYIIDACSALRWDGYLSSSNSPNYLGGVYIFDKRAAYGDYSLGAMGYTGEAAFHGLNHFSDYLTDNPNASYGDAYKFWFNEMEKENFDNWPPISFNYALFGDPTIGPAMPGFDVGDGPIVPSEVILSFWFISIALLTVYFFREYLKYSSWLSIERTRTSLEIVSAFLKEYMGRILVSLGGLSILTAAFFMTRMYQVVSSTSLVVGVALVLFGVAIHYESPEWSIPSLEGFGTVLMYTAPIFMAAAVVTSIFVIPIGATTIPQSSMWTGRSSTGGILIIFYERSYIWLTSPLMLAGLGLLAVGFVLRFIGENW